MAEASVSEAPQTNPVHPKTVHAAARLATPLPSTLTLLSINQVARLMNVSTITVRRYSEQGYLPFLKLGDGSERSPRKYRLSDVEAFLEARTVRK